jgi:hypothetical protein
MNEEIILYGGPRDGERLLVSPRLDRIEVACEVGEPNILSPPVIELHHYERAYQTTYEPHWSRDGVRPGTYVRRETNVFIWIDPRGSDHE